MKQFQSMKLRESRGAVSRREAIMGGFIAAALIFFAFVGLMWYRDHLATGNDNLLGNTAYSVARVNSLDGERCPVNDCPDKGGFCAHMKAEGYVGYFDNRTNKIVGDRPRGYNEAVVATIDGITYQGEKNTMVIKVVTSNGDIRLSWVAGR
ncbi:MAG: hypothetical protein VZR02_04935 [Lachnospiraceae bacterium]|nr:hypothetical protein [Lachnospiraceae bacterium]